MVNKSSASKDADKRKIKEELKALIAKKLPTNHKGQITADDLREVLNKIVDLL